MRACASKRVPTASTTALLSRLNDAEDAAIWDDLDARYRPMIAGVLRRIGFGDEDAQDLAQETLLRFVRESRAGRHEGEACRLRTWTVAIARGRAVELRRRSDLAAAVRADSLLAHLSDADAFADAFDRESRDHVLCSALDVLRRESDTPPVTLRAFERFALAGEPAEVVAEDLGMTSACVYMAKHDCLMRLRALAVELHAAFELG